MENIVCENCLWEGTEEELSSFMKNSETGHNLIEVPCCPNCKHEIEE